MNGENETIKFSVLVPVYNAENYIVNCIESVLNQSYRNYELILVDDGSKDNSGKICDQYAEKYSNVYAYHKENGGQLHTREYAILRATGDYYLFLDADDTFRCNAMETISKILGSEKYDCVIFRAEPVFDGKVLNFAPECEDFCIVDKRELYRKCLLTDAYNPMWRKAVKASIFSNLPDNSDNYRLRIGEDLIQSLHIYRNSKSVMFIGDVLYNYTQNPNSITHSITFDRIDFSVREKVLSFLKEENVFSEKDYVEYRGFCVQSCITMVSMICGFRVKLCEKLKLFQKIRESSFFQNFINVGEYDQTKCKNRAVVFKLFRKGNNFALIFGLPLYWRLHSVVRKVKEGFKVGKSNRKSI